MSPAVSLLPISAIIPTYCRPELTAQALLSIYRQSVCPSEVLIIDDGSPLSSFNRLQELCQQLAQTFPKHKLQLHLQRLQRNLGMPGAVRNIAMNLAKYPWLAFLDSDDIWLPQKLESQWQLREQSGAKVIHCRELWLRYVPPVSETSLRESAQLEIFWNALCQRIPAVIAAKPEWRSVVDELLLPQGFPVPQIVSQKRHKHLRQGNPEQLWPDALQKCILGPSTLLLHKSVASLVGFFEPRIQIAEDYEYFLRIISQYAVTYCPEYLVAKRDNMPQVWEASTATSHSDQSDLLKGTSKNSNFAPDSVFFTEQLRHESLIIQQSMLRLPFLAAAKNPFVWHQKRIFRGDLKATSPGSSLAGRQLSRLYPWIEPFRIAALETLLHSPRSLRLLSSQQRQSAVAELRRKLHICWAGTQKSLARLTAAPSRPEDWQGESRRIRQEAAIYQAKLAYWGEG